MQRFWRDVPASCPSDQVSHRHILGLGLSLSLDRRHSYMQAGEYLKLRDWKEQLRQLAHRMSLHSSRPQRLADAAYCLAAHNRERKWALFDLGLLIDIVIYEAQATGADPDDVLGVRALLARQRLLDLAFARQLQDLGAVRVDASGFETTEIVEQQLGRSLPRVHRVLLWLETPDSLRSVVETSRIWLEPRRADQPILTSVQMARADPLHACVAAGLYCDLAGPCPPALLDDCPPIPHLADDPGRRLTDALEHDSLWLRPRLDVLGAYASNRFYALYDLGPALAKEGKMEDRGILLMLGSSLHFAVQLRDARSLRDDGYYWSLDPQAEPSTALPRFKSYHYWTEALLGCMHHDAGASRSDAVDAAGVIGAHYRRWMTPMYLLYRLFHGGGAEQIARDNDWAVMSHRRGAYMGHRLCSQAVP